jgi:hypothetical protein
VIIAVAASLLAGAAIAAAPLTASRDSRPWLGVRTQALNHMTNFVCGTVQCTAATAEEMANPPVGDEEAQLAYQRGVYSGASEHCGLDWQSRNFVPMMAYWRGRGMNVRQIALVTAIHGMAQGLAKTAMGRIGPCTAETKADLDRRLDFRPPASAR